MTQKDRECRVKSPFPTAKSVFHLRVTETLTAQWYYPRTALDHSSTVVVEAPYTLNPDCSPSPNCKRNPSPNCKRNRSPNCDPVCNPDTWYRELARLLSVTLTHGTGSSLDCLPLQLLESFGVSGFSSDDTSKLGQDHILGVPSLSVRGVVV